MRNVNAVIVSNLIHQDAEVHVPVCVYMRVCVCVLVCVLRLLREDGCELQSCVLEATLPILT